MKKNDLLELIILAVLYANKEGNGIQRKDLLDELEAKYLNPHHFGLQNTISSSNTITSTRKMGEWVVTTLCEAEFITRIEHGIYKINDKGMERLLELLAILEDLLNNAEIIDDAEEIEVFLSENGIELLKQLCKELQEEIAQHLAAKVREKMNNS
ncbi:MAG: hypothetical protein R3Y54_13480 [Eubacteriales bacterium]